MRTFLFLICLCLGTSVVIAQEHTARHYSARRLDGDPPLIDGVLDDEAWQDASWDDGFIQHEPYNGREASQDTRFCIVFDDDNIYVALRAYDSSPDSIVSRLSRRDQEDGDAMGIAFDSYYDRRTAFTFGVTAGGTKFDWIISEDGQNEDHTWDPNWWVRTAIDSLGWTAEMRIPLSQLRFEKNGGQLWGLEVFRMLHRFNELSFWSHIPKDAPGLVHRFGTLSGLDHIDARRILDVTPYTVASTRSYPEEADNPFATGRDSRLKLGLDSKIGLSNYLTLDLSINPDFGQVEADPSEVNLTAFESFFEEKRPFFIEGRNISSFNLGIGDGGIGNDNLFYSRRIGRRPRGEVSLADGAYADIPRFTNIIGAAKLTGKTKDGLSLSFMQNLTAETKAEIDLNGQRSFETVEPLTSFFVGRVQKDQNEGNTIIGGMFTAVNRLLDDRLATQMHRAAYSAGIDFTQYFREKSWMFNLNTAFSRVEGEPEAIVRTQRSSARYFQRPEDGKVRLDSSLTALTGSGGRMQFGKIGEGHINFLIATLWKSPSFEINDIGFMREADQLIQVFWVGYYQWEPRHFYREYRINFNQYTSWDFRGVRTNTAGNVNGFMRFGNYWTTNMGVEYNHGIVSKDLLRGGPAIRIPDILNIWTGLSSDNRKKLIVSMNASGGKGFEGYQDYYNISMGLTYKPVNNMDVSFRPSYNKRHSALQYITESSHGTLPRYVFGSLEQEVIAFSFRLNLTLLPDLSIQYWGQPFVASGSYSDFKYILDPNAPSYGDRFALYGSDQIRLDDAVYLIDEDRNGYTDYSFGRPDFHFREFLSNLVIRWEYQPGSSLFLVWSQDRNSYESNGRIAYIDELDALFGEKASNTFLIKFTYRIGLR